MFKKAMPRFGSTALLLIATLIASGCATTTLYRATPEDTRNLSPAQARELLVKDVLALPCSHYSNEKRNVTVNHKTIKIACADRQPKSYRFAEDPELLAQLNEDPMGAFPITALIYSSGSKEQPMFTIYGSPSHSQARDIVRAWYVWAREGTALYLAQEAVFEQAAQNYLKASVKPQLPEDAVRYKVKAELAVRQKRFKEAADLYDQALGIAPWWPQGHYNRGLILGELGSHDEAVAELKRYLTLEPESANARAVQLKIYEWEGLEPPAVK